MFKSYYSIRNRNEEYALHIFEKLRQSIYAFGAGNYSNTTYFLVESITKSKILKSFLDKPDRAAFDNKIIELESILLNINEQYATRVRIDYSQVKSLLEYNVNGLVKILKNKFPKNLPS